MSKYRPKTAIGNTNFTWVGILLTLILGYGIGLIVYFLVKIFDLKSIIWYIVFFFLTPFSGLFIYWFTKSNSWIRPVFLRFSK
ncbi:hypothetical protein [[Mycoplasma] mobile]|uniref:Expressed protein n=1 Tax=Mycoplasma mobile (strain ATCC 43663 / 163K / NCTC 11711) TaxID=267748 RepID=Q6KI96_MYCM1|nr:hypothetical protein [[Mycoplasma] mobile]AAT27680.1 expressed protein [Mycoplasma mobile 163K]